MSAMIQKNFAAHSAENCSPSIKPLLTDDRRARRRSTMKVANSVQGGKVAAFNVADIENDQSEEEDEEEDEEEIEDAKWKKVRPQLRPVKCFSVMDIFVLCCRYSRPLRRTFSYCSSPQCIHLLARRFSFD